MDWISILLTARWATVYGSPIGNSIPWSSATFLHLVTGTSPFLNFWSQYLETSNSYWACHFSSSSSSFYWLLGIFIAAFVLTAKLYIWLRVAIFVFLLLLWLGMKWLSMCVCLSGFVFPHMYLSLSSCHCNCSLYSCGLSTPGLLTLWVSWHKTLCAAMDTSSW